MKMRGAAGRSLVALLVAVLLLPCAAWAGAEPPWHWEDVPRVVAVGDIHGAYDRLVAMLTEAGVIDAQRAWAGDRAHLVSLGDTVDRGPDSRKVLDLLMRLEREAKEAGGRVHLVLGNHEVMNLVGDLRYVSDEEYRAFADDESPADRERAWERFRQRQAEGESTDDSRVAFEESYPPGFFGLLAAFSPDGVYGSWLLQRNVLVRIDGTAFVHGGLSREVGELDGDELNRRAMGQLREYLALVEQLVERDVLAPETGYAERRELIHQELGTADGELGDLGRRFLEVSEEALVFRRDGPLWYRGTADAEEASEQPVLERALASLGAERVAVGHSPTPDGRIRTRLGGRALLIDAGMLEEVYQGRAAALIQEGGRITAFYPEEELTEELSVAAGVPRPAEAASPAPTDAETEEFLLTAEVMKVEEIGSGVTRPLRVTLRKEGIERRAVFKSGDTFVGTVPDPHSLSSLNRTDRWTYDVAAYRLDRLLELGMVPVAVRRTIQGKEGALQTWVEDAIDEKERRTRSLEQAELEAIDLQLQSMYIFDVLIYNEDRHAGNILFTPADWRLHLIDHTRAFRTKTNRPEALRQVVLAPSPELAQAITDLDDKALREAMKGLLHPMQVTSILKRKKKMIAEWTKQGLLTEAPVGASP